MSTERRTILVSATFLWSTAVFALFAILVCVWFCLSQPSENFDQKRGQARMERLQKLREENQKKLEQYAWADKAKGVVQLPIERAMELVMVELKNKKMQASSVKVEIPYPAGLQQAPAPAASPAATPEVKK